MRKKNYTAAVVLVLAGIMAAGGTGILSYRISCAREEEMVSIGKKSMAFPVQSGITEASEITLGGEKVYREKQKIYLPEEAEIKEEIRRKENAGYRISWNGYDIYYETSGSVKEREADISIGDAVLIADRAVEKYSGQDISDVTFNICLDKNLPQEGDTAYIPLDTDIREDSCELLPGLNRKNYGIRYYSLSIQGIKNHCYNLRINSVTGEVFGYVDFYEKDSVGFRGYHGGEAVKNAKPQFTSIAGEFVKSSLGLGKVREYYAFHTGLMETEKSTRETFDVYCRMEEGDIVVVTLDQEDRKVLCFEINPLLGE